MRAYGTVLTMLALAFTPMAFAQEERTVRLEVTDRQVSGDAVEVAGGLGVVRVTQGDRVELRWTSDETTELHLHGYNVEIELAPGEEGVMAFDARATGRFAIEGHGFGGDHAEKTLIYIEVLPR